MDKLITRWEDIDSQVRNGALPSDDGGVDINAEVARKQLQALRGPWNQTLKTLTGQKIASVQEWRTWINKNPRWKPK